MTGLTKKDQQRVLTHVEAQGVNVLETRKGYLMRFPNGNTAMLHKSTSDSKAPMALRAIFKRNGITWPFDGDEAKLPAEIVGTEVRPKTLDAVKRILGTPLPDYAYPFLLAKQLHTELRPGVAMPRNPSSVTAMRALNQLGYAPTGSYGPTKADGKSWVLKFEQHAPEPVKHVGPPKLPASFFAPEPAPEPEVETEVVAAVAAVAAPAPVTGGDREFLDTVDSWTVDTAELGEVTVDTLMRTLRASGLHVEIRVWRSGS